MISIVLAFQRLHSVKRLQTDVENCLFPEENDLQMLEWGVTSRLVEPRGTNTGSFNMSMGS